MIVKTITYTDYDGNQRTEEFRFHFNKAELLEMVAVPSLKVDFAEAGRDLSKVQKEIASIETEWETAAETLENILREIEKINAQ